MNVLIVSKTHPLNITELYKELNSYYIDNNNIEIFSLQGIALLAEETISKKYIINNIIFGLELISKPELVTKNNKKHLIVFGNIPKECNIKFDYIISYDLNELEEEFKDEYIIKSNNIFKDFLNENKIELNWYFNEDVEYHLYTLRHLLLFLDNILKEK